MIFSKWISPRNLSRRSISLLNQQLREKSVSCWESCLICIPQCCVFRYLEKTFSRALKYSQPHVIAFLGDLMDEGHIANAENFERYKRRLDSIFSMPDDIMVPVPFVSLCSNMALSLFFSENLSTMFILYCLLCLLICSYLFAENLLTRRQWHWRRGRSCLS